MFRFSVLLAFIFAYLFGPSKASPLKKKSLRRRVRAPTPTMTNGLAALDANHLVLRETSRYHDSTESSSSDDGHHHHRHHHRRRRKKGKRHHHHRRFKDCCRRCRRCGGGFTTDSSSVSGRSITSGDDTDTIRDDPVNRPVGSGPPLPRATPPATGPAPTRPLTPVVTTSDYDSESSVAPPCPHPGTLSSSDSEYGHHSGFH